MQRNAVSRYLPVLYLGLALALTAVLLPTALRPPPQAPPSSGALSPDAPPDAEQILLSELGRGSTTTAGAGVAVGVPGQEGVLTAPPPPLRPSRGRCFGQPPRQVESLYAPPCVPAFVGNNGGATWRGVTRDEVRWAIIHARSGSGYEGPVADGPDSDGMVRSWKAWEKYFNNNFELYGRRLRLFIVRAGVNGWQEGTRPRAAVQKADDEYKVMGVTPLASSPAAYDEAIRRDLMHIGFGFGNFREHDPLYWSFLMDASRAVRLGTELICKQLKDKPVSFSGDMTMRGQPRKLGLIAYHDRNFDVNFGELAVEQLRSRCGWELNSRQFYNLDDDSSSLGTVLTKFRADGTNTIWCFCDGIVSVTALTHAATSQGYFPEWVHVGRSNIDRNGTAGGYSPEQWRNSIGFSALEMNGSRPSGTDWYRAYKEINPDDEPETPDFEASPWEHVLHVAGAIQMAGPTLNPQAIREGMIKRWPPRPPEPSWTIGGGYGPTEWSYSKYVQFIWWDPSAPRPDSTSQGAYRYVYNGKRFQEGEMPTEPIPYFKEGITRPPEQERI